MNYQFIKNKLRYAKRFLLGTPTQFDRSAPPAEFSFILNYLEAEDTVYDVGANIGLWSYFLSESEFNFNVVSFEPNPNIISSLDENLSGRSNVKIEKIGIGSVNGKADFRIHPSHGRSSFSDSAENTGCKVISATISTLDTYISNDLSKPLPAFIKVDVEGLEPEVWKGMQLLMQTNRPKVLVFELEDRHLQPRGNSARGLAKSIVDAGYSCFVYSDGIVNINVDEFEFPLHKAISGEKYINNFVFVDSALIKTT